MTASTEHPTMSQAEAVALGFAGFNDVDDVGITEAEGVPAEIRSAIHVAKRENCAWIMWDCDGPQVDELPEYEW